MRLLTRKCMSSVSFERSPLAFHWKRRRGGGTVMSLKREENKKIVKLVKL